MKITIEENLKSIKQWAIDHIILERNLEVEVKRLQKIEEDLRKGIKYQEEQFIEIVEKWEKAEAEVKRLREGIEKIYEYISPTDTPEIYKKVIELLESK